MTNFFKHSECSITNRFRKVTFWITLSGVILSKNPKR